MRLENTVPPFHLRGLQRPTCVCCGGRAQGDDAFICTDCAAIVCLKCVMRRPKCHCGIRFPLKVTRP